MSNAGSINASFNASVSGMDNTSPVFKVLGLSLLSAVLFFNDSNFSNAGSEESNLDWQTLLKVIICAGVGLFGVTRLLRTQHALFQPGMRWCTLFAIWSLLCVPVAVNQTYSILAIGLLLCMVLGALALADTIEPSRVLMTIFVTLEIYLLACWAAHLIAPELNGFDPDTSHAADAARLGGLSHPNSTANKAVLAIAVMLTMLHSRIMSWRALLLPFLFTVATLLLTGSRTWLLASMGMVGVAMWRQIGFQVRILLVCAGVTLSALVAVILVNEINSQVLDKTLAGFSRSGSSDELYSMTGRSELWDLCWEKIRESPIFGYGYGCQQFVLEDHYWKTRHAHNLLLNTILGCGYLGGALLIAMLASQALRVYFTNAYLPTMLLILLVVGGISENPILNPMPGALMLVWLISLTELFNDPIITPKSDDRTVAMDM